MYEGIGALSGWCDQVVDTLDFNNSPGMALFIILPNHIFILKLNSY